jgi:adenylate kinase family enzyme
MTCIIIPIGPPGSGKSYINEELKSLFETTVNINHIEYYSSSRDKLYMEIKKEKSSTQTRKILFDTMMKFFDEMKDKSESKKKSENTNLIIYMDSCNAKKEIRDKFIEYLEPKTIIFINFKIEDIEVLLERTKNRINHPTFPDSVDEQRKIIENIIPVIEYEETPTEMEIETYIDTYIDTDTDIEMITGNIEILNYSLESEFNLIDEISKLIFKK